VNALRPPSPAAPAGRSSPSPCSPPATWPSAIFKVNDLEPGDTVDGAVTITNTGTRPAVFSLTETATNGFADPTNLEMTVTEGTTTVYTGTFGGLATKTLGTFAAGEARTYRFSATLKATAGDDGHGRAATARYVWNAVQTEAVVVDQPTPPPAAGPD
jgi:spore coat-associated protein N